jgi:hypothetical protein
MQQNHFAFFFFGVYFFPDSLYWRFRRDNTAKKALGGRSLDMVIYGGSFGGAWEE